MKVAALLLGSFAALTALLTWPLARDAGRLVPGDYGDPLFISWVMHWVARRVTGAISDPASLARFWDAPIFHPEPGALAFSEHFIPQTLLVLPVIWLSGNPILAYNAAFALSYVLTGTGTALLTRALTGSLAAGALAGVVAAFNEYRLVWEVAHLQTLSIYWFPFVLFGLHRYLATGARASLALAAIAWVALNLSSVYYFAYCAPFVVLFGVVELVRHGRVRDHRVWRDLAVAGAAVALLTLPFMLPYAAMQQRLGFERTPLEIVAHSATLDNYRMALPRLVVPIGLTAVALIAGLARAMRRGRVPQTRRVDPAADRAPAAPPRLSLVLPLAVFAVAAVWLSLGPVIQAGGHDTGLPALYPLLQILPGYAGLRVPARLASIFLVFLGVVAGLGIAAIERWRRPIGLAVGGAAVALFLWQGRDQRIAFDQPLPSRGLAQAPSYLTPAAVLPPIYQAVSRLPPAAVLAEFPFGDPWYDVRYMYFAALHERALLNGYSGVFPASYRTRQATLWRPPRDPARAHDSLAGATHAIVHVGAWPDDYGRHVSEWLEQTEGARLLDDIDGGRLYELASGRE